MIVSDILNISLLFIKKEIYIYISIELRKQKKQNKTKFNKKFELDYFEKNTQ